MSPFEIFLLIVTVGAALLGFRSGLVRQIGSLAGIIAAIIACRIFGPQLAEYWSSSASGASEAAMYYIFAYAAVAIVAYLVMVLVARLARSIIHGLCLGIIDRLAGALFKVLEWLLVCSLAYNLWVAVMPDSAPADGEIWKQRLLTLAPTVIGSETAREFLQGVGNAVTGNH